MRIRRKRFSDDTRLLEFGKICSRWFVTILRETFKYHPSLYFSVFACPLPFFSATAEPFVLKLAVNLRYGVGKTAKHFET